MRSRKGKYLLTSTVGEKVKSFLPSLLPFEPPLDLTTLLPLLTRASEASQHFSISRNWGS
jgi:hypothetical protein